ncbi:MAG: hypothetical protein JWQ66_3910 [Mucilaginibacter sp.]|nr:hypothetical protein [Mucilaginibacter sp.]
MSGILPIVVLVFIRKAKKAANGYSSSGRKTDKVEIKCIENMATKRFLFLV